MQDVRLRTGAAAVLSVAAFFSVPGAAGALVWLLCFSRPREMLRQVRTLFPAFVLILFFCLLLEFTGGGGISYGFRMLVILLIGAWMYSRYRPGDFFALGTWILGKRTGFDVGLVAELGVQSLGLMIADYSRVRYAYQVKGSGRDFCTLVSGASILLKDSLRRAEETAELMAVRGYTCGGSFCPEFKPTFRDFAGSIAALCIGIIAVFPVSEFFIL